MPLFAFIKFNTSKDAIQTFCYATEKEELKMQTKNKNCTSLNYFNCYKQTQKPHPNRKTFNHINGNLYHYAGNNPVKYTDPDGKIAQFAIGALIGAITSGATNFAVQTISNMSSGQDLRNAILNVDLKSVGAATIGGAVTGAISGGLSSIKVIGDAANVYKSVSSALNASSNIIGTATSTVVDNALHNEKLTNNMVENVVIAGISGIITGVSAKTGIKATYYDSNGIRQSSILYSEKISTSGLTSLSTIAPNETLKEIGIGFIQEISSSVIIQQEEQ